MKKVLLSLGLVALTAGAAMAQHNHSHDDHAGHNHGAPAQPAAAAPTSLTVDNMVFKSEVHDFGTVQEGGAADYEFRFTNTGKEPIIIQRVQASCGCTTPDWTKDPILPGKSGFVKASYGTQGRPGHFDKTLTVFSNAGNKVLTIKGDVEKAPESSVPQNSSMIRTN
jgi:hypothetical protein